MNKLMISTLASALLLTAPAFAGTQADLTMCRKALAEQGHFDQKAHSLKFSHRKGNTRKRTVFLTLKNRADSTKQTVECKLERKDVIDMTLAPRK
ncbi:MAG: hypothetical protein AB8G18_12645 [Gammaproteobacteria bacterium]